MAAYGGAATGRRLVVALTLAWGAGVGVGFGVVQGPWEFPVATAGVILLLGVANLFRIRIPSAALVAATALVGLARGVMNGAAARAADGQWLSVFGIVMGVFVLVTLLSAFSMWLERRRAAVVCRVAGSWIAAIGLLMLGWEIRN